MKRKKKNIKKAGDVLPFRAEDDAVAAAWNRSENASRMINEAIRHHENDAVLSILERDAIAAKHKYDRAIEAHAKRKSVS